ncbi:MAG: MerR family transcriptional regulator [Christensenellales bacterium]|jgi:DNA-binding transcriptional MerR regulator
MYTIKQVSERTGLSIYTLRYYDKEGLLPLVHRSQSGIRQFSERDLAWLGLICCLKDSGMSIAHIKQFMQLCLRGSSTCQQRKQMLLAHREEILSQMRRLQESLDTVNYKIDHCEQVGIFHIDGEEESV